MASLSEEIYRKGLELFEEGKYLEAEPYLREIIRQNPNYADVQNKLGVIASMKGDLKKAVEYFETALKLNPFYTEALLNLAVTYNELGEFQKAQEAFQNARQLAISGKKNIDPYLAGKLANEHFKLGNLYFDMDLYEDAIDEYRKALNLRPNLPDVRVKLGMALRATGKIGLAIQEFTQAKEINPNFVQAWIQLGITYYMQGHAGLAVEEWKKALEINPELKEVKTYLSLLKAKDIS